MIVEIRSHLSTLEDVAQEDMRIFEERLEKLNKKLNGRMEVESVQGENYEKYLG